MSNKDGWIRHHGGKCPVENGVMVEVRRRNGLIESLIDLDVENVDETWLHVDDRDDIMAYRPHKPAEQVDDKADPKAAAQNAINPIQWRDRIREIDATSEALEVERADLLQKLADEGLALLRVDGKVAPKDAGADMSDWRNWKVGDLVEMLNGSSWADMTTGRMYVVTQADIGGFSFLDDAIETRYLPCRMADDYAKDFKWRSRP